MVYTVDYTSVISTMHCRHVVTFLLRQTSSSVSSSEENRCRGDAISMFRVRTRVTELVVLVATVVDHCTLIKHRENLICSLVFPYISDDKNTDYIKICELSTASYRGILGLCIMTFIFHMA